MNRTTFRAGACALSLLIAGCGNEKTDDTSPAFVAAADALSARLGSGVAPPATDPTVQAFEAQADAALQNLGTPKLPVTGFDSYEELCGKTATIAGSYVNMGVAQAPEAERLALMNRNAEQYLDRLFTPLLFSAHCTAAHLPFIEKTVEVSDDKRAALEQVRQGAYGQAEGMLQMVGAGDMDPARKRKLIDQLAADAGSFAIVFSAAQREALARMAESVRAGLPEGARGQVDKVRSALQQAPCGKLCTM